MARLDAAALRERFGREGPQVARTVVAAAAGWQVCQLLDPTEPPIFAAIVPLVAMRDHPFSALNVSLDRLLGVVGGVLLGILVVGRLGPSVLAVCLVLAVGLLAGVVLRFGPSLNVQVSASALLVFASADPGHYGWLRLWETLVGAAVTVALSPFLFPPDAARKYRERYRAVRARIVDDLAKAVAYLTHDSRPAAPPSDLLDDTFRTQAGADQLPGTLEAAQRAVRVNPLRRRDRAPLAALAAPTGTTVTLSEEVRRLVEELTEFWDRRDLADVWAASGPALVQVLGPVVRALDERVVDADERQHLLDRSWGELDRWRQADRRPAAAVLRRPATRILQTTAVLLLPEEAERYRYRGDDAASGLPRNG